MVTLCHTIMTGVIALKLAVAGFKLRWQLRTSQAAGAT